MVLPTAPTPADNYWTRSGLANALPENFLNNMSLDLAPTKNALLKVLNKIGLINIITVPTVQNPFMRYVGTDMPFGQYTENLQIGITKAEKFDPTSCTRGFFGTDIVGWYGEMNDSSIYKKSVSDTEILPVVHDSVGFNKLSDGIIQSMYNSAQNDFVAKFEKQFARISTGPTDLSGYTGGYETIGITTDGTTAKDDAEVALDLLTAVKFYVNEFKGIRTEYNKLGLPMVVEGNIQPDVLMTRHMWSEIQMALASKYHTTGFEIDANVVLVDSFATPAGDIGQIGALVIDPRVLLYHMQYYNVKSEECSTGRSTLYSLVEKGIFNFLWGYNAVAVMLGPQDKAYTATPVTLPTGD